VFTVGDKVVVLPVGRATTIIGIDTPSVDPFDEVEMRLARCWLPATDPA